MNPLPAFSHLSLREPLMALFTGGSTPDGEVKDDGDLSEIHDGKVQNDEHNLRIKNVTAGAQCGIGRSANARSWKPGQVSA